MQGSVTVHMDAPPEAVWELVSDITRIGEYSPETFEAEWTQGSAGPAVGATFRGHVRRNGRGPVYWTQCRVVACDRPREFAFDVVVGDRPVNTWRYALAPSGAGTDVTESFQLPDTLPSRVYWALAGWARGRANRNGMRQTLERMKKAVEAQPAG